MAKKNARTATATTAGASTDAGTPDATATTATPRAQRDPANQIYWNDERKIALLSLIYQNQGLLTAGQVAAQLVSHSAFADQAALLASGLKISEKIRSQVKKLATKAVELGRPEPKLRRGAGGRTDVARVFDAIFGPATVATAPVMPTPTPIQQAAQPQPIQTPVMSAQPVLTGGLISIPG